MTQYNKNENINYTILVDSRDRDYARYPSPSNYRIELADIYKDVMYAKLVNIEIPMTFYMFNNRYAKNTSIRVKLFDPFSRNNLVASENVMLPDGNYDNVSMGIAFKNALDNAFNQYSIVFTVNFDKATLKYTVNTNQNHFIQFDCSNHQNDRPTEWGLGYHLGFDKGVSSISTYLSSPNVVNLNPNKYIVMEINDLNGVQEGARNVFAKLALCAHGADSILHRSHIVTCERPLNPCLPKLSHLDIRFRFHDGSQVDFNNIEHSFSIILTCKQPGF